MNARFRRAMLVVLGLLASRQRPLDAVTLATPDPTLEAQFPIATEVAPTTVPAAEPTTMPSPTSPSASPAQGLDGKIFYLAAYGVTINTIRPDGTDVQLLLRVDKQPDEEVINLSGEPSGTFLTYGVASLKQAVWPRYFLVQNGLATTLPSFATPPRWSPTGRRFAVQLAGAAEAPGAMFLYDTEAGTGEALAVAGNPDWFPDGTRLVYVAGDVWAYDLATGASTRLTQLPTEGDEMWYVQEAHVPPGGQQIVFYGGQRKSLGASGNGQQWWWIPASGGKPQPFHGQGGNTILGYAVSPTGTVQAYAESAHSSACVSEQRIVALTTDPADDVEMLAPVPPTIESSDSAAFYLKGFSWSPTGDRIAYAVEPYRCPPDATAPVTTTAAIYSWTVGQASGLEDGVPRKIVDGSFPVWIR